MKGSERYTKDCADNEPNVSVISRSLNVILRKVKFSIDLKNLLLILSGISAG